MHNFLNIYFPDKNAEQNTVNRILDITDFVCDFYRDYLKSRIISLGKDFPEVCYPLFFSLNFHLIKSYVDSQDRRLYTKFQKEKSTFYGDIFHKRIFQIEQQRTAELNDLIDNYLLSNKCKKFPSSLTQKDIVIDFGSAFIKCCDELIKDFGPDSMGLMSAGFLESAFYCICLFIADDSFLDKVEDVCMKTQQDIASALGDYRKNKIKMDVEEN
jgi:hypothetical protein